jgi:dihydroorotate dehydrogenase (fumarate)
MAGAPLHPLALGNVATLRRMLDENGTKLGHVKIIGVGGVLDADGYRRMKAAGAYAVSVGTGLGLKGVSVFEDIERRLEGLW